MAKITNSKTQTGTVNLSLLNIPISSKCDPVYIKPIANPQKSGRDKFLVKTRSIHGRKK